MRKISARLLSLCALWLAAQQPAAAQHTQRLNGWPTAATAQELPAGFVAPSAGYGNVPFFWLNGDTLRRDRMSDILDTLATSATSGFSVSYIHKNANIDSVEHKSGYGMFGHTEPANRKSSRRPGGSSGTGFQAPVPIGAWAWAWTTIR